LLSITKSRSDSIYCDCNGNILSVLKCSLQESLFLILVIILNNSCLESENYIAMMGVAPKYYSVVHYRMEVREVYHSQGLQ
jgi:hypothetical protein